jgi:hypothetical protein
MNIRPVKKPVEISVKKSVKKFSKKPIEKIDNISSDEVN